MSSDVSFTIGGDDKEAKKAFERQQREIAKLREQINKTNTDAKKGQEGSNSAMGGGVTKLTEMAQGLVNVQAIVGMVKQAYAEWAERMDKIAEKSKQFSKDLVKDLAQANRLAEGPKIEKSLKAIKGASHEESRQAFNAITGANTELSTDKALDLTASVARAAPLGDTAKMGEMAGELADVYADRSAADITDMLLILQEQAGDNAGKLARPQFLKAVQLMVASGAASREESMAMGVQALNANMRPALIENVADKVGSKNLEKRKGGPGRRLTAEDKAYNQFVAASSPERLKLLQENENVSRAVLGEGAAAEFAMIDSSKTQSLAARQRESTSKDILGEKLQQALVANPEMARTLSRQDEQEEAHDNMAPRAKEYAAGKKFLEATLDSQDASIAHRALAHMNFWASSMVGDVANYMTAGLVGPDENRTGKFGLRAAGMNSEGIAKYEAEQTAVEQLEELRKQTEAMQTIAKNVSGKTPPPPGNSER